ncbi:helix-turn-helix transcriptional regulator [Acinetobacter sp. C26M]|uniref:helix-turn-helix domain-containing protein n=1 Tax=unclassified Acinetobacter TaxID=196816 RepID=UPI0014236253|nr:MULTISPECIES: helix-turn-helix transcriptional regulator [unclassified Acinetobacter]NIE96799.1 helix-turn-helix transcriptional regulator [Acinetobacter sp. Tr-809]USA45591.1 helix-turn-helix transcriptional regulator [Acinetobacter sp. C26M]USA49091.1 helix-turn-helix transcriptional regulator [Acinetobacter sp. C26G]
MTSSIHTNEMNILCQWLKSQRKIQNLTMRELAIRMDKPHSYVQKVEQGERRLDVVEYIWYCDALRIDPQTGIHLIVEAMQFNVENR